MAIPKEWKECRLEEACLGKGQYGANAPKQPFDSTLPRYIRITDIDASGRLKADDAVSIDHEIARDYIVAEDDILIARSGATVGKSYIHRNTATICAYAGYLIRFQTHPEKLSPTFLSHYLHTPEYWKWVADTQRAQAQPNINAGEYGSLLIPLPPLPEQKKIAAVLSSVDAAIEKTEAVIAQLQVVKKAMMEQLLTKGLPGRHTRFKQTELGEIPEEWEVVELCAVANVQTGIAKGKAVGPNAVSIPYLRVANVQDGFVDLAEIKEIEVTPDQLQRFSLQPGDVLFCEGGDADKVGRGTVWQGQITPCLHQNHVFAVRPHKAKLLPEFLSLVRASDMGKQYFLDCAKQTTNLASINSTQLKAFPLPLPNLAEQNALVAALGSIAADIEKERIVLALYHSLKSSLSSSLLSGELRVPTDSVPCPV